MNLSVHLFQPEDLLACVGLLQAGHDPAFSSARFTWLHQQAPLGPSAIAVCTDGSRVVGVYSVIRKTLRLGERSFVGGRDVDPVVHPDYRGRGIFSRLLRFGLENFEGIDVYFNFANKVSAPGFRRQGWRDAGPIEDRVCQLGFRSPLSRDFLIWLGSGAIVSPRPSADARELTADEVEALLTRADLAPDSFAVYPPPARLWVERSSAYLRWRYLKNPQTGYRWFAHGAAGAEESVAICRHDPVKNRLTVLDVLGFGRAPNLALWLPLWRRLFPGAWVGVWSTMPVSSRRGFIANPLRRGQGHPLLVRSFPRGDLPSTIHRPDGWFLTHGDLEVA